MAMPFSDEDLKPAVEKSLAKVEPSLALDGGGIRLLDIRNGVVFVQLLGGCVGCSASHLTIRYTVEKQLKIDIHPEIRVINVPVGMEDKLEELV
jgi:Fe-S cluster biogenesis protein NfuA